MKIMNFTKRLLFLGILFLLFGNTETVFADTIKTPTFSSIENISSTEIKLNFKSNSSCTECGIEILNETTGYFYRVSNAATSYNLKGLTNGKTYKFKISMYYIQSGIYYNSPWSPSKSIKVSAPVVDQPITVNKPSFNKLERIGYNKMKLSYSTSGLTTGVEVYNITTNKKYKTTNKSNFTFSNLTYNKKYEFKLRSYYTSSGKTVYSSWTSSLASTAKLPTPTFNSIEISDYNNAVLSYKTTGTITGVQVYNVTTGSSVKKSYKTRYVISNLKFNKKYTYKIRSYYKTSSGKYYYSYYTSTKSIVTKKLPSKRFDGKLYKFYQANYHQRYCGVSIASSGCGPTSMAITSSSLLNKKITPVTLAKYGCSVGEYGSGKGATHEFFNRALKKYGLKGSWVTKGNSDEALKALSTGKAIVIAHMGRGHFTRGGHYITLVGVKDNGNNVLIQDPASKSRSKYWSFSIVKKEAKTTTYSTPFLIVTKN